MRILHLALILLATKIAGDVSVKLGQPAVFGKLLVGILLGPSVLGLIENTELLKELSEIGVILLMFLAGLETDLDEFKKSGKPAFLVGVGGIVFPFIGGYAVGVLFGYDTVTSVFMGLLFTATSVSISVQTLRELGRLRSPEGMAILGAAVVDDILVILLLAIVMTLTGAEEVNIGLLLLKKAVFFAGALLVAWKVVPPVMRWLSRLRVTESLASGALIICFFYAYAADAFGIAPIIGAFIAGAAIGATTFERQVLEKVEPISYAFFVPVFFTSIGVAAELKGLGDNVGLAVILSLVALLTKLIGAYLGARASGFSHRPSLAVGVGMISRGEVALIIASIGLSEKLLPPSLFTVALLVILVTTLATPPLLKWVYRN
ncbi:MAG: cation:proton antiporter [Calditerricola sp.]|nr:cation:proton antiporter [Calditerricola sp.]